jgi:hypothetical protein
MLAFGQTLPPTAASEKVTGQSPKPGSPQTNFVDYEWEGVLAEVTAQETRFFRTRRAGAALDAAKIEYGGDGSVLVGFECNVVDDAVNTKTIINSIRPVYLNSGRRFLGKSLGSTKGKLIRISAKDGYAVSEINCNVGTAFTGLQVSFARLQPDGMLDLKDTYPSPPLGLAMGQSIILGGVPFCGFYVGQAEDSGPLLCLAFLVPQKLVRDHAPKLIPKRRQEWKPPPTAEELAFPPLPAAGDPTMLELARTAAERVFIVTTPAAKTTGFLCRIEDKNWLALNQQTIAGTPKIQFASPAKGPVAVGEGRAAIDHDLAAFAMPETSPGYELLPDLVANCKVGDAVAIAGYDSTGALKPLLGRLRRFENKFLELDVVPAPEYQGAPVIHLKSGRVIAIAKWASKRVFNGETATVPPKWIFDRLDTMKAWEPIQWATYQADAALPAEATSLTDALFAIHNHRGTEPLNRNKQDPRLRTAFALLPPPGTAALTQEARQRVLDGFIQELKRISKTNIDAVSQKVRYDYFKRFLVNEVQVQNSVLFYINSQRDKFLPPAVESRAADRKAPIIPPRTTPLIPPKRSTPIPAKR